MDLNVDRAQETTSTQSGWVQLWWYRLLHVGNNSCAISRNCEIFGGQPQACNSNTQLSRESFSSGVKALVSNVGTMSIPEHDHLEVDQVI